MTNFLNHPAVRPHERCCGAVKRMVQTGSIQTGGSRLSQPAGGKKYFLTSGSGVFRKLKRNIAGLADRTHLANPGFFGNSSVNKI